jgi:deaminated glutathione amidase
VLAIENQNYLIASAQAGDYDCDRKTYGHSMIIDPLGRVLSEVGTGERIMLAEIDPKLTQAVRKCLSALEHRVFV